MVHALRTAIALFVLCLAVQFSSAYSVLTHEEIVDLLWQDQIQPLLKRQFPSATEEDLRKAHAYAYGGSLMRTSVTTHSGTSTSATLCTMCAAAISS